MFKFSLLSAILLNGVVVIAGCSSTISPGAPASPAIPLLQEIGDLLRSNATAKPPAKLADIKAGRTLNPGGYDAVKSGEIVVVWGAPMPGEGEVESGTAPTGVIAYEKKTPEAGGYVLLQNGEVAQMTADQFKAAPKAK